VLLLVQFFEFHKYVVLLKPSPMQTDARSISTIWADKNGRARYFQRLKCITPLEMPLI
jgi:hypothetical protein